MKVTYNAEERILKVVTDISKAVVDAGIASLKAVDEKGNEKYRVAINNSGEGSISDFSITCNTFINGKAALVKIMPADTTLADIKKEYGKQLVAATHYCGLISAQASAETETIDSLFAEAAENAEPDWTV